MIALKPVDETTVEGILSPEEEASGLRLIRKGRRLVLAGTEPFSAVEAIAAAREERDEMLLAYRKDTKTDARG